MRFYSVESVAEILNCTPRTVRELVRRGELRGAQFGKGYVFSEADVLACYQARVEDKEAPPWPPSLP